MYIGRRGNRVRRRRFCEPERGGVLGVLRLVHQTCAILLEQVLLEVLPNIEGNGRRNGAADSEVKRRELFAGSKSPSPCGYVSAVKS
jgi:hypothetical protein